MANACAMPLLELKGCCSPACYAWLQAEDAIEAERQLEIEAPAPLFDADEDEEYERVLSWTSSSTRPDGYGGYDDDGAVEEVEATAVKACIEILNFFVFFSALHSKAILCPCLSPQSRTHDNGR